MFSDSWLISCHSLAHDTYYSSLLINQDVFKLFSTAIWVATTNEQEFAWEMKPICHPGSHRLF